MKHAAPVLVKYLFSIYVLAKAEVEFACVDQGNEDGTSHCFTLAATCREDEKIQIDHIHYGVKNSGNCSTNITNCKTFLEGCCAYTSTDEIDHISPSEVWLIFDQCEGKRNCSFEPTEIGLKELKSKDFLMFEYFCVNDSETIHLHMCDETTTTVTTQQVDLIYSSMHVYAHSDDMRRKCTCDISPTYENTSVELKLINVNLMDKNLSCTSTRLKLADNVLLACGVFTDLSLTMEKPFTIELEMSTKEPPGNLWISAKAKDGILKINCSSKTYNTTYMAGPDGQCNQTSFAHEDCLKCDADHLNLPVVITVPVSALIIVVAMVITAIFVKNRSTTKDSRSAPRKDVNSVDSPFYHVVEAHDLEIHVRNSRQRSVSDSNTGIHQTNTETAAPNELQTSTGIDNASNQLAPPTVSHYERISLSATNDDPSVRYTSYNVEQSPDLSQQTENLDMPTTEIGKESVTSENDHSEAKGENETEESVSPARYDKLKFSKPPSYKLPTYHTVEGTLSREAEHK